MPRDHRERSHEPPHHRPYHDKKNDGTRKDCKDHVTSDHVKRSVGFINGIMHTRNQYYLFYLHSSLLNRSYM